MKVVSSALSTHMASENTTLARLIKITRTATDGAIFRYTDHDKDIAISETQSTGVNAATNVGTGTVQATSSITPLTASDFAVIVTSVSTLPGPAGWSNPSLCVYTKQLSSAVSFIVPDLLGGQIEGTPDDEWANVIATFPIIGAVSQLQTKQLVPDGTITGPATIAVTLNSSVTQGSTIFVAVAVTSPGTPGVLTISDSAGNIYTAKYVQKTDSNYSVAAYLFVAENVPAGPLTITVLTQTNTNLVECRAFEMAGISSGTGTYLSSDGLTISAVEHKADGSPNNATATGFLNTTEISEHDVRARLFDGARFELRIVNWMDTTQGVMRVLSGTVGDITMKRGMYTMELRGITQYLTTIIGSIYGPYCRAELFGGGAEGIDPGNHWKCRLNRADWAQTGFVASSPDSITIVPVNSESIEQELLMIGSATPDASAPAGWFNDGVLKFTSGVLNGYSFEVATWDGSSLALFGGAPMPYAPSPGDTFEIEPGCQKTIDVCHNKFSNQINFAGEAQIPGLNVIGAVSRTQVPNA